MKKKIVITGGAGFVGTNLIKYLLKKTNYDLISIDNYSSGFLRNHVKSRRVKYIRGSTKNIDKLLTNPKKYSQYFTSENLQGYIKAFYKWKNVWTQIRLEQIQYLIIV